MKRNIIRLIILLLVLAESCSKQSDSTATATPESSASTRTVTLDTRSLASLTSLPYVSRMYAFDHSGAFLCSRALTDTVTDYYVPATASRLVALAGMKDAPMTTSCYDSLMAVKTCLLDNDTVAFIATASAAASDKVISFDLHRTVARLFWSVKDSVTDPFFASDILRVKEVFLVNVAGENNVGLTGEPSSDGLWLNRRIQDDTTESHLLSSGVLLRSLAYGDTLIGNRPLYAYPNSHTDVTDTVWCARATRLAVHASLGIYDGYYPVTVTPVESNATYRVHLVITGPGNPGPDDPAKPTYAKVTITSEPWDDGGKGDFEQ